MDSKFEKSKNITLGHWNFNIIDIHDKDLYSKYIKETEYPANLWTTNFALLWAISQSKTRKVLWKIVDDMLVTFSYLRSGELYMMGLPYGEGDAQKVLSVARKCLKYCHMLNHYDDSSTIIKTINGLQLKFLREVPEFDRWFKVIPMVGLEKHFSIQKLISLSGKEFDTIRRKINKFKRLNPDIVVRKYRQDDYDKVMQLGEHWNNTAGQKYSHIFDGVYFPEIIGHCSELDHLVLVVEQKGDIIGMVSGGELPNGQSWWCMSKYMDDYDGLSEFLIIELAREINKTNPSIKLMNAGSDLGFEGLRFFKERFRPELDLKRYIVMLKQ